MFYSLKVNTLHWHSHNSMEASFLLACNSWTQVQKVNYYVHYMYMDSIIVFCQLI